MLPAYLKLVRAPTADWDTEAHFLAVAARAIRQVLINYARDRRAQKRGGDRQRISISKARGSGVQAGPSTDAWDDRFIELDHAHTRLADHS